VSPLVLLVLLSLALAGCSILPGQQVRISGRVYGGSIVSREGEHAKPIGLAATVECNGVKAAAAANGSYSLALDAASEYDCKASGEPNYAPGTTVIGKTNAQTIRLDFGPARTGACATTTKPFAVMCPELHPLAGSMRGAVTYATSHQPFGNNLIRCWNTSADPDGPENGAVYSSSTDASGGYSLVELPAGQYGCVADGDSTLYRATVAPGAMATLHIYVCDANCPVVSYHGGQVMHSVTAYVIFWLPSGRDFEPGGDNQRFETLLTQYFQDVGDTPLSNIVTQYWDAHGPATATVMLGGSYVDTRAYPHAGTLSDPLLDDDVQGEITRAIAQNHWTSDLDHEFFVVTAYDTQECGDASLRACTATGDTRGFCAYHDVFAGTVYAYIPVVSPCTYLPSFQQNGSPNGDHVADAVIDSMSHEHFESVTDPQGQGWYDKSPRDGEIGDKCDESFGAIQPDGSNVTLNNGHSYIVQMEWSNRANGCALK
jgi:hypothetical protein